jgi:hypothetical protein
MEQNQKQMPGFFSFAFIMILIVGGFNSCSELVLGPKSEKPSRVVSQVQPVALQSKPVEQVKPKTVEEDVPHKSEWFGHYGVVRNHIYDTAQLGYDWELLECSDARYLKKQNAWETFCRIKIENRYKGYDFGYLRALIQHDKVIDLKDATKAVNAALKN